MKINAGVWIDHRKAVVVLLTKDGETVQQFLSADDGSKGSSSGAKAQHSHTSKDFMPEDKLERKAEIHLNKFYDQVIECLHDVESLAIFGPGEAKGEFIKRSIRKKLKGRIAHVGTVDKMTDGQIAAHVRDLFADGAARPKSVAGQAN